MIWVGIIEDKIEIREALSSYFRSTFDVCCSFATESVEDFLSAVSDKTVIDVLLLDIGLPGISGINGIHLIKEKFPDINIIIITVYEDEDKIFNALKNGAAGYLLKNTPFPKIKKAIEDIQNGGAPMTPVIARKVVTFFSDNKRQSTKNSLTPKEKHVVAGLIDGLSYKKIAECLGNSVETIRNHIRNIYRKLEVNSRTEVVAKSAKDIFNFN
ncbi:MAG: response regulator transcription factor [Chlorobi bacterium]|nr:response regulator transcription factor [Chlorobiota bacterium]